MPRSMQAAVGCAVVMFAGWIGTGCVAQRQPVVVIEPVYSVVRGGGPVVDAAKTGPSAPLSVIIADAEPGL